MTILFITKYKWTGVGGVERHVKNIINLLSQRKYKVTVISESDIKYPHLKFIGLVYIWFWFLKNIKLIFNADIVHIHDVFIWYLPFRFLFPLKRVYITFHGWEGVYPIPFWNILNKKIANFLCNGSIAVGKYIEKYYGIKANYIIYGGVDIINNKNKNFKKNKKIIVWLGRQDNDTGINEFKKWLLKQKTKYRVFYVTNVKNPEKYLKNAKICVPSGYLSYLEAKNMHCKILTFAHNDLKFDYWNEIKKIRGIPTWESVFQVYLKLWGM